ncbi:MAG: hypothetical protein EOO93_18385, partial [Pedobacter sp.]
MTSTNTFKVLIVLTSHDQLGDTGLKTGFWSEEFAGPYYTLAEQGAEITLASPLGGRPPLDPKSELPEFQTEWTKRFDADDALQNKLSHTLKLSEVNAQDFDTGFKKFHVESLRSDLDFVFKKYGDIHPEFYKNVSKEEVAKRLERLKVEILMPLNRIEFMNKFSPILYHIVKDGHNYVNGPNEEFEKYLKNGGLLFPIAVQMKNHKIFCDSKNTAVPFGSEITKINDLPSSFVIDKILAGYNAENQEFAEATNSPWFSGSFWYAFGNMYSYNITYTSADGDEKNIRLGGLKQSAIDASRISKQSKENYSFRIVDGSNVGLITYNLCEDLENFRPFCEKVFSTLKNNGSTDLIIDIRNNPGGTTRLGEVLYEYITTGKISQFEKIETRISQEKKSEYVQSRRKYEKSFKWYHYLYYPIYVLSNKDRRQILMAKNGSTMIKRFSPEAPKQNPLLFRGNIYLLIGKKTYSAAAILASAFKHYGLGKLVGEETGQATTFTANTVELMLPQTKLVCSVSTSKLYMIGTNN